MTPNLTEDELKKVLHITATYRPCCPDDAETPCRTCFLMNAAMSLVYEVESRRRHDPAPAVGRVLRIPDADAGIGNAETEIRPRSATGTVVQKDEETRRDDDQAAATDNMGISKRIGSRRKGTCLSSLP